MADKCDLAFQAAVRRGTKVVDSRKVDNFRFQSFISRTTAIPQGRDCKFLRKWRHDFGRLFTANPCWHLIFFNTDIVEAERLQLIDRPRARPGFSFGTALTRPDLCREPFDNVIGNFVGIKRGRAHVFECWRCKKRCEGG